jgi:phosphoribosyl-ATP pyrophosphohydrolase
MIRNTDASIYAPWNAVVANAQTRAEAAETRVAELEAKNEQLEDENADVSYALLCQLDAEAAEHTDLYTWIKGKLARVAELETQNEAMHDENESARGHAEHALDAAQARIAELEAERGIPPKCPECGEPVTVAAHHVSFEKVVYFIHCMFCDFDMSKMKRIGFSVIEYKDGYKTIDDAWRAFRDVCDADAKKFE